jgi:hypothetical protein
MNPNTNTWLSWITTGIGLAGSAAATKGLIDQSTATSIAGVAATLVPLLWGLFIHRDSKVVETASEIKGVAPIQIQPTAAPALQTMAKDDSIKTVVEAAPPPSPYATSRQRL